MSAGNLKKQAKHHRKRTLSLLIVCAMLFSLVLPAYASASESITDTDVSTVYEEPEYSVDSGISESQNDILPAGEQDEAYTSEPESSDETEATSADTEYENEISETAATDDSTEETVDYPAQDFAAETADGITVNASVEEGVFPEGTTLTAEDVDISYAAEKAQEALGDDKILVGVAGVDITFFDADGNEIQPKDNSKVHVTLKWNESVEGDEFSVIHVQDDGNAEEVENVAEANESAASFETDSFSIYVEAGYTTASVNSIDGNTTVAVGETLSLRTSITNAYSHRWTSDNESVATVSGSGTNATVTGVSGGTATITHHYQYYSWTRERSESIEITVTGPTKVYVYVSARGMSEEMLELLGIDPGTLDGNGFFPAGEIYIDSDYLSGKPASSNTGAALINSTEDWNTVLSALSNMNTSTLTGVYAANRGNVVSEYLAQAEADIDGYIGSGQTALFRWNMSTSYGFDDQSVEYHLDLRFSTRQITFITGNNGIQSGSSADDGTTIDHRVYITNSIIQDPRNLNIPEGYTLDGYYTDPDFTTRWDGIGTELSEDQTVYIKLKAETAVDEAGYINVQKTFTGLTQEQVPSGFTLTVAGSTLTLGNARTRTQDENGITYTWRIDNVSAGSYSVAENNEEVSGYDVSSSIPGSGTVTVSAAEMDANFRRSNNNNTRSWPVSISGDTSTFFAAKMKEKTIIITKNNLSVSQRMTIQNIIARDNAMASSTYEFYNLEGKSEIAFSIYSDILGGSTNLNYKDGYVTFAATKVWQHVGTGTYSISKAAENPDVQVTNTYTRSIMDLTITKRVEGNMGDKTKSFPFTATDANGNPILDTNGNAISLRDGESATLTGLQIGSVIYLTEANGDYTPAVQYGTFSEDGSFSGTSVTQSENGSYAITLEADKTGILVTNTKEAVPETGIVTDSAPYGLLLGLLAIAGGILVYGRRRRQQ